MSVGQKIWHSLCQTSILLQASKPLALPGLAMELQACFPYALSLVFSLVVFSAILSESLIMKEKERGIYNEIGNSGV